jgi:phosphohistidine phosphatase SixA
VKSSTEDVWLVRHACAGHGDEWTRPDDERPLDVAGKVQATALGRLLAQEAPGRLISSPSRRCVETLLPLSRRLRLEVDVEPLLAQDASGGVAKLVHDACTRNAVLCTHGEVLESFLKCLHEEGVRVKHDRTDDELLMKGAAWRLRLDEPKGPRLKLMVPVGVQSCPHHPHD